MDRLLTEYSSEDYKRHFDFVDFLRPEKRAARLRQLEQMLVDALNNREIDDAHMAAPEVLDPLDLAGFRFSSQDEDDQAHPDPRISAYLDSREDEALDLKLLKADRLIALRTDGETYREWPVYRGLVYEVTLDNDLYVLTGGDWFRINVDFKQRVYD